MKEHAVASQIRLFAAQRGVELWRNNVGVLTDATGRPVRYGLANDSSGLNKNVKSSDLIGIAPIVVTPDMVGTVVGVFIAIETKASDWVYNPKDERTIAQKNFHDIVKLVGGRAGFAKSVQDFYGIITNETINR
jgi:hypothetical protein